MNSGIEVRQGRRPRQFLLFTLHQRISTGGAAIFSAVIWTQVVALTHRWVPALHFETSKLGADRSAGFSPAGSDRVIGGFLVGTVTEAGALLLAWIIPLLFSAHGPFLLFIRRLRSLPIYLVTPGSPRADFLTRLYSQSRFLRCFPMHWKQDRDDLITVTVWTGAEQ